MKKTHFTENVRNLTYLVLERMMFSSCILRLETPLSPGNKTVFT